MSEDANTSQNIFGASIPDTVLTMGDWNNSNLKFFSRYDGPFVPREVTIGNHALRKILKKNFEYMSRNLFFVSAFGRFLLGSENIEAVLKAEEIADRTLQNSIDDITRRIAHATAILKANGVGESAQNGKLQIMLIPITSPGARKYVELLVLADSFYNINSLLWIIGHIDSSNKFKNESDVRKEVQGAVRGIANQFAFILNLTRRKDPAEALKVGDHDEAHLAANAEKELESLGKMSVGADVADALPLAGTEADAVVAKASKKKVAKDEQPVDA